MDNSETSLLISEMMSTLTPEDIPKHIAIIMDGNGRWAKDRHWGRIRGHRAGVHSIREVVDLSARLKIKILTLFAFSTENWSRPKTEVAALWKLLSEFLIKEVPKLKEKNIRLMTIGKTEELPKKVCKTLEWALKETKKCDGLCLNLALNYGARNELVDAFNSLLEKKNLLKGPITMDQIQEHLYTKDLPDPDLLIRTSGEYRLSNFLLWQLSYTELFFSKTLWPDFSKKDFLEALIEYRSRNRRFGAL